MSSNLRDDQPAKRLLVQDEARLEDVEIKHQRVRELLTNAGADALLLQDPGNIAWLSSGADVYRWATEECPTCIFVTPEARLFATNSVDSAQIFEREAFGLGFQLKQREWFQPHNDLVDDLCRGRNVISDKGAKQTTAAAELIQGMRLPLTPLEVRRMRLLSKVAVHAVEATAHNLKPGTTESEVAGEVSHRLLKRTVAAARIQVCADGRNERYRHWAYGEHPIENYAAISCVARRWGLHAGVTRTVCLNSVPSQLWKAYQKALMIHATGQFFSRNGETFADVWKKVHRIYEKFDMQNEWQLADVAGVMGYRISESQMAPDSTEIFRAPSPVFWHPSVGPAMVGDTILCRERSNEQLTLSPSWPQVPVRVKGREVLSPGILLNEDVSMADDSVRRQKTTADLSKSSYDCLAHPGEELPDQLDSIWEIEMPPENTGWSADDSPFPQQSAVE